jgi:hypothetical protein
MLAGAEADAAWVGQIVILRNHGLALRAMHAMLAGDTAWRWTWGGSASPSM